MKTSDIMCYSLDNGMKVLIKEIHHSPLVLMLPFLNVGSNNESDDIAGISHFIEHLLFKGTRKRGKNQLAKEIETLGGMFNAFTSNCFTAYYVLVPSRNFSKAIEIQFDQLTNPTFPKDEIDRERRVVLEEIRICNDIPMQQVFDNLNQVAFQKHWNGRRVIGHKKVIENVERSRILSYYSNYYKPNNTSLIICGDVKSDEIIPQIEKIYGKWRKGKVNFEHSPAEPIQRDVRTTFKTMEMQENFISLGFKIPEFMHPDTLGLQILQYLLVECGESGRLVKSLKNEKKIVSELFTYLSSNTALGLFTIVGIQPTNKTPNQVVIAIMEEIQKLKEKGFTSQELQKAKNHIFRNFMSKIEEISDYGVELGVYNCYGNYLFIEEYWNKLQQIAIKELKEILDKYFSVENMSISELLPGNSKPTVVKSTLKRVASTIQKAKTAKKPGNNRQVKNLPLQVKKCEGYKLILEERHYIPKVSAAILFKCGSAYENKGNNGISQVMMESILKGTRSKTAEDISLELDNWGSSVRSICSKEYCYLLVESLSDYFRPSMEIVLGSLTNAVFPEEEIEKQKNNLITNLHTIEDMPIAFSRYFFEKVYFGDHPYGLCELGSESALTKINRQDVVKWHERFVLQGKIIIAVVGDITSEEITPVADKYLSKLEYKELPKIPEFKYGNKRLFGEKTQNREQSHLVIGEEGPVYGENKHEFDVLEAILGWMSGRLFKQLRDDQSLAYAVYPLQRQYAKAGVLGVYIGTKPEQENIAKKGILKELQNLKEKFPSSAEIEKAKNMCLSQYIDKKQYFGSSASMYAVEESYGRDAIKLLDYPKKIKDVTEKQLRKLVNQYINPEKAAIAIIHGTKKIS